MTDLAGQYLGRYYLKERLGEGGMATVYKAYDTRLERDVAVKIIRSAAFPMEALDSILKRFEREAKSLAKLSHPNIVKVYDYGDHDGSPYLVMEYLPGGTLKKFIGKPMNWQEAIRLLLPIARGVAYAHQRGILHRDIKPANILITEDGDPMLSDFGIAKLFEGEQTTALTGSGMAIGTPEYMAPEQWTGTTSIQSDLYSLGIVLYEMVAGRKPYMGDTPAAILIKQATEPLPSPRKFAVEIPESLEDVLVKALAKDPEDRYKSINAFSSALENLQVNMPARLPSESSPVEETFQVPAPKPFVAVPTQISPQNDIHDEVVSPFDKDGADSVSSDSVKMPHQEAGRTVHAIGVQEAGDQTFAHPTRSTGKISRRAIGFLVGGIFIALALWLGLPAMGKWLSPSTAATEQATDASGLSTPPILASQTLDLTQISETPFQVMTSTNIESPTLVPGTAKISPVDGMTLHYIPAGTFTMGDTAEHAAAECEKTGPSPDGCTIDKFSNEEPVHQVYLDAFWMDETEVTNAMYNLCVKAGVCSLPSALDYYPKDQFANYPVVFVSWEDARTYCEWAGRRLPTEAEWEKAARGIDGRTYPWGEAIGKTYANYNLYVGDATTVGQYEDGKSPYGLYDMAGNVYEFVADWYQPNYYETLGRTVNNPLGPTTGQNHVAKGGGYLYNAIRPAQREARDRPSNENGFRCVLPIDVETPGSATQTTPTESLNDQATQTPLPAGILFYDDFEGVEQVYSYSPSGSGLAFTTVVTLDDDHHNVLKAEPAEHRSIKFGEYSWENYVVEFDFMLSGKIRKDPDAWFAIIMRADSASPYEQYVSFFSLRDDNLVHAYQQCPARCLGVEAEAITSVTTYIQTDLWYHIRVEISNDRMSTYINDVLKLRTNDSRITNGKPGFDFSCCTGLTYYFDNIQVKEIK